VKEGPGAGKSVAEWIVHGEPSIEVHQSDIARFYPDQRTPQHVKGRAAEGFNKTYGIVHPAEQWTSSRGVRVSPFYDRERGLGAVFYEAGAWERPQWYESNAGLVEEYGVPAREHEWDARWWSPIVNAEHLAMRDRAAMIDLTAFCVFDVAGPGALESVQRVSLRQLDVKIGRTVYTPVLSPRGAFKSDLTIMRLDDDRFRVVTGGAHGAADQKWFADHLVGEARLEDLTSTWCTLGLWGPRARAILGSITEADLSNEAFSFATWQTISVDGVEVLASRISYVGELGWELYVPVGDGARLWDAVWEAGRPQGVVPAGIGV
jgi:glycine cleavage system aminomethyltransferase T